MRTPTAANEVANPLRLPPVSTRDTVVVNWHALPYTHSTSYPICLMLVQGVNDYSWGSTFNGGSCSEPAGHALAGSGPTTTSPRATARPSCRQPEPSALDPMAAP